MGGNQTMSQKLCPQCKGRDMEQSCINCKDEGWVDDSVETDEPNELLAKIPCLPQRQDSLLNQMQDLYHVANKLGLHDAADRLRYQFNLS